MLMAASAFGLGRRFWSSQQCYLHCLHTSKFDINVHEITHYTLPPKIYFGTDWRRRCWRQPANPGCCDAIDATLCWFRVRSVGAAGYWWGMHGTSGTVLGCQSATWSHYCMQSRLHCGRFAVWHFHVSRCSLQFTSLHFIYPPVQNTNAMCTVGNVLQQSGRLQQGATCTNNCPI